jgi:hypothetical protein
VRLSLPDAVKRGLQTNLGIVTSGVSSSIVRAQRAQTLSQLFPQITASIGATETQINLAVLMVIGGIMFFLSFLLQGNKPKKQAMAAH